MRADRCLVLLACLAAPAGAAVALPTHAATQERAPARGAGDGFLFSRVGDGPAVTDVASSPSASWTDVDGDGDEDLYVLNGYGSMEEEPVPQPDVLYRNDGAGRLETTAAVCTPAPEMAASVGWAERRVPVWL